LHPFGFGQTNPSTQERPRRALPTEPEPQTSSKSIPIWCRFEWSPRRQRRLARNLKKEDFKLYEDGSTPIASFNIEKIERRAASGGDRLRDDLSAAMTPEEVIVSDAMREFSRRFGRHPAVSR